MNISVKNTSVIDLFCGVWWLSYGLQKAWFTIKAGIDFDNTCSFAYTENIKSDFINVDIANIKGDDLLKKYWNNNDCRILVWCAPCQPFSNAANTLKEKDEKKWNLLLQFQRLIMETAPQIISMENVPNLIRKDIFNNFVQFLKDNKYFVSYQIVYCPDYGIPQKRKRVFFVASRKPIDAKLVQTNGSEKDIRNNPTLKPYERVIDWIGKFDNEKYFDGANLSTEGKLEYELSCIPFGKKLYCIVRKRASSWSSICRRKKILVISP